MAGAVSFVLGLLGLGAGAGVSARQAISHNKKIREHNEMFGWTTDDPEVQKMRERVRKEWANTVVCAPNCIGKWSFEYPDGRGPNYQTKLWFEAHLKAKGIPYDEVVLNEVSGVTFEEWQKRELNKVVRR